MKLSEAIRKGCEMVPKQAVGFGLKCESFMSVVHPRPDHAACALEAAGLAVCGWGATPREIWDAAENLCRSSGLSSTAVFSRNDTSWTREQIVAWLESMGK